MAFNQEIIDFSPAEPSHIDNFIARWSDTGGSERANYQLFLTELCALLSLPQPDPAGDDTANNAYVFERRVDINNADGSANRGYIDLYKRDCFVLEAKQTGKALDSDVWDKAMLRAQNQADQYVRALPAEEGRPPFIVITDVGRSIELYAEFSRSGGTYVPFPDPRHYRIRLEELSNHDIQKRLFLLWQKPEALDPSKYAAKVTKVISAKLAELARSLEQQGYDVQRVAHFLKRCLFTMFSEDVGLLPQESFTNLLEKQKQNPENFADALHALWESMNSGGYSAVLNERIRQFNGGLFRDIDPIALNAEQIQLLIDAAKADWRFVEPAIFGTLLERALDPRERHKLGAHYTPRAYVERLVMPTIIEPLREQWRGVQVAAEAWLQKGKPDKAVEELRQFHFQLCQTRVLDPACGSGNFLYVSLEHMKRLEGEVMNVISDLSAGQASFDTQGLTVDPHQFLGLEINPRAAAIAEIVMWIGYLQWHYRIYGNLNIPDPVLRDFQNIEHRDALIEYDNRDSVYDDQGKPVTIWDGISYEPSPTTGELIPDESGRSTVYRYINPRKAKWPKADYIVGNPPFIGNKRMRGALGEGYTNAIRSTWSEVPESADFVMYWWHIAAMSIRENAAKQFGFITTNSIRQSFNRRVLESHLKNGQQPIYLGFAIPDHPWVDSNDGAAVRIAMTVCCSVFREGRLCNVIHERETGEDAREIEMNERRGTINPDLSIGANVSTSTLLRANYGLANRGMIPHGEGFLVSEDQADYLDEGGLLKPYRNGRDITKRPRNLLVIDTYELGEGELRDRFPQTWQWLHERVKPKRDQNPRKSRRENWWLFGESQPRLRASLVGLRNYIVTVQTAKHRFFTFLDQSILPDDKLIAIGLEDAYFLGVLSSRVHTLWALVTGGALGVGNDPIYNKSKCFDAFPFPPVPEGIEKIRLIAAKLDRHRKQQQAQYSVLTTTDMYNVLEKLRLGEPLTDKEKDIHQKGLISVLKEIHDDLDRAVFEVYNWSDLADKLVGRPGATTPLPDKPTDQADAEEELLSRLVALNFQRAVEEGQGHVRWLRPEYQAPGATQGQAGLGLEGVTHKAVVTPTGKQTWPKTIPEQVIAIRDLLQKGPRSLDDVAGQFKRKPAKGVEQVLAAMQVLGQIEQDEGQWHLV